MIGTETFGRLLAELCGLQRATAHAANGCEALAGPRLNYVSDEGEYLIDQVRECLDGECAGRASTLEAVLALLTQCSVGTHERTLDLISHSTGEDSVLRFADLELEPRQATAELFAPLAGHLRALDVTAVRLLGCGTATTAAGLDALKMIHAAINPSGSTSAIEVYGTDGLLSLYDFDKAGLAQTTTQLVPSTAALPATPLMSTPRAWRGLACVAPNRPFALGELQPTRSDALHVAPFGALAKLVSFIHPSSARRLPGLLAWPCARLAIPVAPHVAWFHRFDVLYQWRLVRAYPIGFPEGIVYDVRDVAIDELRRFVAKLLRLTAPHG